MNRATLHDLAVNLRCALDLLVDARAHVGERLDADRNAERVEHGIGLDIARANIGNGAWLVRCVVEALEALPPATFAPGIGTSVPASVDELHRVSRLEALAALEHEQWSHWTRHLLTVLEPLADFAAEHHYQPGDVAECWARWRRQIETPYSALSEPDKESDREWARKALAVMGAPEAPAPSPCSAVLYPLNGTWRYCVAGGGDVTTETDTGIPVLEDAGVSVEQIAEALGRPFAEIVAELTAAHVPEADSFARLELIAVAIGGGAPPPWTARRGYTAADAAADIRAVSRRLQGRAERAPRLDDRGTLITEASTTGKERRR